MRDRAHHGRMDRRGQPDARPGAARAPRSVERPSCAGVDLDEVRLDLIEVDGNTCFVERLGERARARVVLGEPFDVVVERVDAGGRDDARLPHRSAEQVLLPPGALDQLVRAGEQRSERAPEPLREAERHRVEARRRSRRRDAGRNRGVEEACAVEVHRRRRRAPHRPPRRARRAARSGRPSCCACPRARAARTRSATSCSARQPRPAPA